MRKCISKKVIAILLLTAMAAGTVAGCGKKENDTRQDNSNSSIVIPVDSEIDEPGTGQYRRCYSRFGTA